MLLLLFSSSVYTQLCWPDLDWPDLASVRVKIWLTEQTRALLLLLLVHCRSDDIVVSGLVILPSPLAPPPPPPPSRLSGQSGAAGGQATLWLQPSCLPDCPAGRHRIPSLQDLHSSQHVSLSFSLLVWGRWSWWRWRWWRWLRWWWWYKGTTTLQDYKSVLNFDRKWSGGWGAWQCIQSW